MERFTTHTPMGELFRLKECQDIADYWISTDPPGQRLQDETTLQDLKKKDPNRNIDSMCDGVNHLLDKIRQGVPVVWDFWSEEEKQRVPKKQITKLFWLPADEKTEEKKPFVAICAGGGYTSVCSLVEAFPVARRINQLGYDAFVISYRVGGPALLPAPMEDLAQALRFILEKADSFGVAKENYAVAGFSAGGHLVAEWGADNVGYAAYGLHKPAAIFPVYPVIDMDLIVKRGGGFIQTIVGDDVEKALREYSVQNHVWKGYPPTFSVHCKDDPGVLPWHSECLQEAIRAQGIPCRMKLGATGGHGIGEGRGSDVEGWIEEALAFWKEQWQ